MASSTSSTLLEGLRGPGGAGAWREFYRRYVPMLTAFARRFGLVGDDASDAIQETLVAVWKRFSASNEPFDRSTGRFKAWLHGIGRNKMLDALHESRRPRPGHQIATAREESSDEFDAWFELEWRRHLLARALERVRMKVDPVVYESFELYAVHGRPAAEVARLLGITRNGVYINKCRALSMVRIEIADLIRQEEQT